MAHTKTILAWLAALCMLPSAAHAQFDFTIAGRPVQVHSFGSQGFAYSDDNNYLTMKSSKGSFAMTDFGANISMSVTDKFRVGAQIYDRNIGNLGDWHPQLDWAVADYKFKDWFGIRGGVVKTTFGLENDTQDMDFLHTFALLPQSVYPTDLRDSLIRHRGGDVYGSIPLQRLGSLSYTAFAGLRQDSQYGGYPYMLTITGIKFHEYGGLQVGGDLRWNTPIAGLLVGASHVGADITGKGPWTFTMPGLPPTTVEYEEHSNRDWTNQFYGQYTRGNLRLAGEYRRYWRDEDLWNTWQVTTDVRGWYTSASYRLSKHLEIGSYYSRFVNTWLDTVPGQGMPAGGQDSPLRHVYDKVVTARIDLNRYWNLKVEGHFMDGNGSVGLYPVGFYSQDNPQGMSPKTNLLIVRTGFNF